MTPVIKAVIHHHAQQNNDLSKEINRILLILFIKPEKSPNQVRLIFLSFSICIH